MGPAPKRRSAIQLRYVSTYQKHADKLMPPSERARMEDDIALNAARHPVIPQTGGWRKARWAIEGKGKSAGVRVIYFFVTVPGTIFFQETRAQRSLGAAGESCFFPVGGPRRALCALRTSTPKMKNRLRLRMTRRR